MDYLISGVACPNRAKGQPTPGWHYNYLSLLNYYVAMRMTSDI